MSTFPVHLNTWEPQPGATVYIQVDGDIIPVQLERDPTTALPARWTLVGGSEVFDCGRYRWWCPRATDFP